MKLVRHHFDIERRKNAEIFPAALLPSFLPSFHSPFPVLPTFASSNPNVMKLSPSYIQHAFPPPYFIILSNKLHHPPSPRLARYLAPRFHLLSSRRLTLVPCCDFGFMKSLLFFLLFLLLLFSSLLFIFIFSSSSLLFASSVLFFHLLSSSSSLPLFSPFIIFFSGIPSETRADMD